MTNTQNAKSPSFIMRLLRDHNPITIVLAIIAMAAPVIILIALVQHPSVAPAASHQSTTSVQYKDGEASFWAYTSRNPTWAQDTGKNTCSIIVLTHRLDASAPLDGVTTRRPPNEDFTRGCLDTYDIATHPGDRPNSVIDPYASDSGG